MPQATIENTVKRERAEIILTDCSDQLIDAAIHKVVNDRFEDALKVTRTPSGDTPGKTIWIVSSRDPGYLFGFRIMREGSHLHVKNGVNTWSMWAEYFSRHTLAKYLNCKLSINGKVIDPTPEKFIDLKSWMATLNLDLKLNNLPDDYKRIGGI